MLLEHILRIGIFRGPTVDHGHNFCEVIRLSGVGGCEEREGACWMTGEDGDGELVDCDLGVVRSDFWCHAAARPSVFGVFIEACSGPIELKVSSCEARRSQTEED